MFTAAELAAMRAAQDLYMMDTCVRQVYSRTFDSYGAPAETYTDQTPALVCGLDMRPGSEQHRQDMTTLEYDATLRLPIGTAIDEKDRIKITKRFGEAITSQVYRVEGPIQRGPSGIRLRLRKVDA